MALAIFEGSRGFQPSSKIAFASLLLRPNFRYTVKLKRVIATVSPEGRISNITRALQLGLLILLLPHSVAGAKIGIQFDGQPAVAAGTVVKVSEYFEAGMWFRPISPGTQFGRVATNFADYPNGRSAYINAAEGETLALSFTNGSVFDFRAVTLAEYTTNIPSVTVQFVGYRNDGSIVSTTLQTDPDREWTEDYHGFEAFYLDWRGFTNLIKVEIPTSGWSIDTIVVIPKTPPRITAITISNSMPVIDFETLKYPGTSNFLYGADFSTDLLNWTYLPDDFTVSDGGAAQLIDPNAVGSIPRFYRIRAD
jgi:hypothetical protein